MTTIVTLLRHGETDWNRAKRFQGHTDIPLNEAGRAQAARVAARFAAEGYRPGVVLSSDLARAAETAARIGEAVGVPPVTDPGWRERSMGAFEGRSLAQIEAELPAEFAAWRADRDGFAAPGGGESYDQLRARVGAALTALRSRGVPEVLVVTHGGVVAAAVAVAHGSSRPPAAMKFFGNTAVTRLVSRPDGGWDTPLVGCTAHLEASATGEFHP